MHRFFLIWYDCKHRNPAELSDTLTARPTPAQAVPDRDGPNPL